MDRIAFVWFHLTGRIGRLTWLGFSVLIGLLEYLTESILREAFHWPSLPRFGEGQLLSAYFGDEILFSRGSDILVAFAGHRHQALA